MAFAAIAALNSCSQNEEFALDNGQSSYDKNAVTFGTYLGQEPKTRATVTTIDVMKGDGYPGFGVFAYNTGASNFADASDATPDFMYNVPVKWNSSAWTYGEEKQWPENEKVSFFAYAPHTATSGAANITALPSEAATGAPVISFKMAEQVGDQIDLLYADAKTDQTKETNGGKVQFSFKHALSRVGFKAKLNEEVSGAVKSITINNIILKSSALSISADLNLRTGEWSNHTAEATEYTLNANDFIENSNVFTAGAGVNEAVQLTGDGKYLMLIPTQSDSKVPMTITVNYIEEDTDGNRTTYSVPTTFEQAFVQGKAYNFVLAISLASSDDTGSNVKFDVMEVNPWTTEGAPEGDEVPITSDSGEMATVILHDTNGEKSTAANFTGGSTRFVVKLEKGESITFKIPEFQNNNVLLPNYFKGYKIIDDYKNEIFLCGWSEEQIEVRVVGSDTANEIDEAFADKLDKIYKTGAEFKVDAGKTLSLYPVFYETDW